MNHYRLSVIGAAVITTLLPATVMAAEADWDNVERLTVEGTQQDSYLSESSSVASKMDLSILETPQSITVFSREQMDDFALNDLNQVLENTNAINVEQVETDRTYFTARGFKINNFQLDGLGLPLINDNAHGSIDTALYERVEIVRGANGLMTGVGNPSATINLVRKKPNDKLYANVTGTLGSWDKNRIQADVSAPLADNIRGRAVLMKEDKASYLNRYKTDKTLAYAVMDFALSGDSLLTVGHSESRNDADGNLWGALTLYYGNGTPTNFDASTNTAAKWSYWNVDESRSFVDFSQQLGEDWVLRAAYNRVRTDEDSELFYTYLADPAVGLNPETGLGLIGYGSEYDLDDKQDMLDIYISGQFDAFGRQHDLVVGANWARLDYADTSLYDFTTGHGFPVMPAMENWDGDTPYPTFSDGLTGSDIDNNQRALYASARFNLADRLYLLTGARLNQWETSGTSYGEDEYRDDSEVIPYFGLTYGITEDITTYASYTETFVSQTERDRNLELLAPLTGKSKEVGVKANVFNGRALVSLAYFDVEQANLAVSDGEVVNPDTGVPEQVYKGSKGINSQGFEFELAGEITQGLQASIGYTQFDIDGDEVVEAYTPEKTLDMALSYRVPQLEALKFGVSAQWQDDIYREQGTVSAAYPNADEAIITRQDAYNLVNLMASYDINESLTLSANANNITDEKYLNSLYWAQGYYGAPRHYSVSLSWTL
ncbi:Ferric-pseudobactin 358 receptor [Saliniradius amylolyticus]|uniref:Ferric-pseudobactin 358 receptor n=1 Tax=Saliniradius amylolyticus TaxID=2183582 RepID=A0A2S2E767_9ALTE|nr:TonB-dependent siderophore receptor [Saliniradius amylolyticus]AWL13080.1 Ferric-pseudobactin 358 receptor [Saliniradius amylolyticus]